MDRLVTGHQRHTRYSRLCDDQPIVRIPDSHQCGGLQKKVSIVYPQLKVLCLHQGNKQYPERQAKPNLPRLGEQHISYREGLNAARKELVLKALSRTQGNRSAAAQLLGLESKYLLKLIKSLGIK